MTLPKSHAGLEVCRYQLSHGWLDTSSPRPFCFGGHLNPKPGALNSGEFKDQRVRSEVPGPRPTEALEMFSAFRVWVLCLSGAVFLVGFFGRPTCLVLVTLGVIVVRGIEPGMAMHHHHHLHQHHIHRHLVLLL